MINHVYNYPPTFSNSGTVRKTGGSGTTTINCPFVNHGILDVLAGTLYFQNHEVSQTAGSIIFSGGSLNTGQPLTLTGGELTGDGVILGSINNSGGTIRPGIGIGKITITGNYARGLAGHLILEISGTSPNIQHDQLAVTGQPNLSGTIEDVLTNGFVPSSGQTFQLMNFGTKSGELPTIMTPLFGEDMKFQHSWYPTDLTLSVGRTVFGDWKTSKFGALASDPLVSGGMSDPNRNGVSNFLEFAFGVEPLRFRPSRDSCHNCGCGWHRYTALSKRESHLLIPVIS